MTTSNPVQDFKTILNSGAFNIESQISEKEAEEAITLFSVVNIMLGGTSQRRVGNEDKTDVLGVLTLFYGLQDKSLPSQIVVRSQDVWTAIQVILKELRDQLDRLGADAIFLAKEAKRQFNLGRNNDVAGNTNFPVLFRRYVDIVNDPLLSLDIRREDQANSFTDKEKIGRAYDLLRDLKDVILQLVRSLSKYGTVATNQANADWAKYEAQALDVLKIVAQKRVSDDLDELNPWSVLADLTGKDRDTVIAPYVVLGRNGGNLLGLALETYQKDKDQLDNFDRQHLLDLFQAGNDEVPFFTTRMRDQAAVIKRYPLTTWG
jgi:hypothetical protein